MNFAYCRVSSVDQKLESQKENIPDNIDRLYEEKISGIKTDRPELTSMLMNLRPNDTIWCFSLDRLGRNCQDLLKIVETIVNKGASIHFEKENLTFSAKKDNDASYITNTFLLQILSACSEMERNNIRFRQALGIKAAKEKGVYKGRAYMLNADQVKELKDTFDSTRTSISQLAKKFKISRSSCYRYLKSASLKQLV